MSSSFQTDLKILVTLHNSVKILHISVIFIYQRFFFPDYEKINCTFEESFCYWIQDLDDDSDWKRIQGPTFPAMTGPDFDHTFGNMSGKIKYKLLADKKEKLDLAYITMTIITMDSSQWYYQDVILFCHKNESGPLDKTFYVAGCHLVEMYQN